jgi:CubicO group peptidase (beta-lactamase class C family)
MNVGTQPLPTFPQPDRQARVLAASVQLEALFQRYVTRHHIPGVAFGVVLDHELIYANAYGVQSVATGAPVTTTSVFRIASMTKSFAALAILQLRDAGMLRLDDAAAEYVPELAALAYPNADAAPVTVRQLLAMAPGWPQDDPWADRQLYRPDRDLNAIYAEGIAFSNPPSVTFEYSNMAYIVLGRIITNVSGMPALNYITERILRPLGMHSTVWNADDVAREQLAVGHRWEDDTWREEELLPSGGDVAAFAGLFTTLPDLARWVGLFQSAWPPRDDADDGVLGRASLREMQQVWTMDTPGVHAATIGLPGAVSAGGYGFGLSLRHNGEYRTVGHGGGLPGYGSHMRWAPDYGLGIIALANVTYANVHAACTEALDLLITQSPVEPRRVHPATALTHARDGINRLLAAWDDALADELFADNFFLDTDRARRRREFADLRARHGSLQPDGPFDAENWLRGRWRMQGVRGWCSVWISLSPTVPPRVQALAIESVLPPSPAMQAAVEALAALTARPTLRALDRLRAPENDRAALWDQVRLANILCGPCTVADVLGGDGECQARFRFAGEKGNVEVDVRIDARGKIVDAGFGPVGK